MKVEIRKLDGEGKDVLVGSIFWDGKTLQATPTDSALLQKIMAEPVGNLTPDHPEEWLAALHRKYKSPYLRASRASQKNEKAEASPSGS